MVNAARLMMNMARRLIFKRTWSSVLFGGAISLLALNPTSDRKVEADDSPAARIPDISSTPTKVGMTFIAAQTMFSWAGSIPGLIRLMAAPDNIRTR